MAITTAAVRAAATLKSSTTLSSRVTVKPTATMAAELAVGQRLIGKAGTYILTKQLQDCGDCVWTAKDKKDENVIIKSVRHWRLRNERNVLKRFQDKTPYIRPLIDEIEDPKDPPAIVLRWLDDDILDASNAQRLTRPEVKQIAKSVLGALKVIHNGGYIHSDIKPKNILVNYGNEGARLKEVQLADMGGTIPSKSTFAEEGWEMGTEIFRSPEAHLQLTLGPSMDIWAFGATLISLMWGENFHIFDPDLSPSHPDFLIGILKKHYKFFGPWPGSYAELAEEETQEKLTEILIYIMKTSELKCFEYASEKEICKEDKEFILKIMKLDPRDRPTVDDLLQDEWFCEIPDPVTFQAPLYHEPADRLIASSAPTAEAILEPGIGMGDRQGGALA